MYPYQQQTPPYIDPMIMAKLYYKEMKKAERKATEAEKEKAKPKPKSRWETIDWKFLVFAQWALFPIVGPPLGIWYLHILVSFKESLVLLLK
jgi:hypothetical protein